MRECEINMSDLHVDKQFFNRIYAMSRKKKGLNQIAIKMNRYMKFHMNLAYSNSGITDNQLKDLCKIWKNLKSLTSIQLYLPLYERPFI